MVMTSKEGKKVRVLQGATTRLDENISIVRVASFSFVALYEHCARYTGVATNERLNERIRPP